MKAGQNGQDRGSSKTKGERMSRRFLLAALVVLVSVLVAGVTVGRVDAMRVDPTDYSAIATLRILTGLRLPTDSMASIKTTGLIGDKYVFLSPGADDTFLEPGTRITMTESSVDLESLLGKMAFGSADKETEQSPPP